MEEIHTRGRVIYLRCQERCVEGLETGTRERSDGLRERKAFAYVSFGHVWGDDEAGGAETGVIHYASC